MERNEQVRIVEITIHNIKTAIETNRSEMALDLIEELKSQVGIFRDITQLHAKNIGLMVSTYFGITLEEMKLHKRDTKYSYPRQVYMYMLDKYTNMKLAEIGITAGGFNHATVIHARGVVEDYMFADKQKREEINELCNNIEHILNETAPEEVVSQEEFELVN